MRKLAGSRWQVVGGRSGYKPLETLGQVVDLLASCARVVFAMVGLVITRRFVSSLYEPRPQLYAQANWLKHSLNSWFYPSSTGLIVNTTKEINK